MNGMLIRDYQKVVSFFLPYSDDIIIFYLYLGGERYVKSKGKRGIV